MSPLPEQETPQRTTTGEFRVAEAPPISEQSPVRLGLVIAFVSVFVVGIAHAAVTMAKVSNLETKVEKLEALSGNFSIANQRTDDKLDRIAEEQREMRVDLKEMKSDLRGVRR